MEEINTLQDFSNCTVVRHSRPESGNGIYIFTKNEMIGHLQ